MTPKMARRILGTMPLKNITNALQGKRAPLLTESEYAVLESHTKAEKAEMCAASKYMKKIMKYYDELDRPHIFIEKDITYEMRSLLGDWMINCCEKLGLCDDTFYLGMHLIDRFLSGRTISPGKLQLVGITALVIAAKYEEVLCPDLNSFLLLSDNSFDCNDLKKAEKYMMYSLEYRVAFVSPLVFLRRVSKANNYETTSRKMAKYFLELMVLHGEFSKYKKNILSTTAMYLARKICRADFNKNLFFYYAGIEKHDMKECFDSLTRVVYDSPCYENLENKYSRPSMHEVNVIARDYAQNNFN
ncbi:G2/mitotic-specific cyclin 2 [Pancytospora epiphaga]|nr:G2/mitotic-specific cyclin 2 [Pancytospora epiphaga]